MVSAPPSIYIPLDYAAEKYNLSKNALLERVKSGRIASAQLPNGEYLVAENDVDPSLNIRREDFKHLQGKKISMSEASRKYDVAQVNVSRWAKANYITILERGWQVLLDEGDVAYTGAVYKAKKEIYGKMQGVPVFNEAGKPYQLKYPDLADRKRRQRRKKR
jgi:hypothetical protein